MGCTDEPLIRHQQQQQQQQQQMKVGVGRHKTCFNSNLVSSQYVYFLQQNIDKINVDNNLE